MVNKKCVVVYRSRTGFTKNYANWLAEALHCDLLQGEKTKVEDLLKYDTILYGGGLYASGMNGVKLITKNYELLKDKEIVIFAVGATPVRSATTEEIKKMNLPGEFYDKIPFYYLRGGFDYSRLSLFHKILMTLLKIKLKSIKNPDADEKGMLASYSHPVDFTKKKYIEPILQYVTRDLGGN